LVASSETKLQEFVTRVHGAASDTGMKINMRKTEVIKVWDDAPPMRVTVNNELISEVALLRYLGARFNAEALCDKDQTSSGTRKNEKAGSPMAKLGYKPSSESKAHSDSGMADSHIWC